MILEQAEIVFNECVAPDLCHLGLQAPAMAARIAPGQFFMVRVAPALDPLLRRPFAAHRVFRGSDSGTVEMLYRVVGRGTRLLTEKRPGERLDLLGPLGRGFSLPMAKGPVLLVAGGIGIAPLPFLATELVRAEQGGPFTLYFGGRSEVDLVCVDHFLNLGFQVELVSEDGSIGRKGLVTEYLEDYLGRAGELPVMIYSCGPVPMQRKVAELGASLGIRVEVSMEARMACGVGACLGCSLRCRPLPGGVDPYYASVCQDGPVFAAEAIIWEEAEPAAAERRMDGSAGWRAAGRGPEPGAE